MTSNADLEYLTREQIDKFHRDGYLVISGFLNTDTVAALLNRSKELLADFNIDDHPLTRFTTGDDDHVGDDYFLTSGDKIRFFLEKDAFDQDGKLTRPKDKAVNKIGHALHELDPLFRKVTLENQRTKQLVRDLRFHRDPVALQSMVITKQQHIGGEGNTVVKLFSVHPIEISLHFPIGELAYNLQFQNTMTRRSWYGSHVFLTISRTDLSYTNQYTDPPSALGFWIPLEKCTAENGALSFLPGSHLTTLITKRFVRLPTGGTGFEHLPIPTKEAPPSTGEYVLECCEPGDLVLIHGSVLHKSEKNLSPSTRFAYTFHMIDSPPHVTYDEKNWLQPTKAMPFSHVLA